ncbi:MAG: phosphoketolase family protein [Burkholderiaceae bacterium]
MHAAVPDDSASSAPLSAERLQRIDGWWRAANYLSVGQIYLQDNPLLGEPLRREHIKPRLLGHWGTTPGLNFIHVHLNRLIVDHDLDVMAVIGPGHGGPGVVANAYLEGTWSERYPAVEPDRHGMRRLFRQFSWPLGISSHCGAEVPGSIHEGGELGYSLAHAYGAAFDNPDLIVACVVGDGEAETGALATSWHSNKFLNPARDGVVLPILHLNGFKIANPTVLARIGDDELRALLTGYGHEPFFVSGDEPMAMHARMAEVLDQVLERIRAIQRRARARPPADAERPRWPMIVLRTPKGWTGPREVRGKRVEGHWRSHQVPLTGFDDPAAVAQLEAWLRSYRPEQLFDEQGRLAPSLASLAPTGSRRISANPHANGGEVWQPLSLPSPRQHALAVPAPGRVDAESTRVLGAYLRDLMARDRSSHRFRLFGPDETASNRLDDVYPSSDGKVWLARREADDTDLHADGRVMEVLSEHLCQGWLEGYLLTGRHGLFSCYEAFIPIVDSMVNQHAKWLKVSREIGWRKPIASLNYLLTSHVWRQDHNGFSHQDPGFIDHLTNKKADVARIYLPADANCLLAVADHCLRSRHVINVIIAGKQPAPQWLDYDEAATHCAAGAGVWEWASDAGEPDVVMACAGDVPTLETLAAVSLLRERHPDLRVRVVNVVDLMALQTRDEHPHGLQDDLFDAMFGVDRPVVFAFHGYPALIHKLCYKRPCHDRLHVHGYREEGTTTTPFDMVVRNGVDRFSLALAAVRHVPRLADRVAAQTQWYEAMLQQHRRYISEHGDDLPSVKDWRWPGQRAIGVG